MKYVLLFHVNQTNLHLNDFAPGLILKQRQKAILNWHISSLVFIKIVKSFRYLFGSTELSSIVVFVVVVVAVASSGNGIVVARGGGAGSPFLLTLVSVFIWLIDKFV